MSVAINVAENIWKFILPEPNSGCWLWIGAQQYSGYGIWSFRGRDRLSHRFVYEWLRGPIPKGLTLDHLCRVTSCVNPSHLEPVTMKVNILRGNGWAGRQARQTECKRGHPLSGENLYMVGTMRNCRSCRIVARRIARGTMVLSPSEPWPLLLPV